MPPPYVAALPVKVQLAIFGEELTLNIPPPWLSGLVALGGYLTTINGKDNE
jgi:hypothetical protein